MLGGGWLKVSMFLWKIGCVRHSKDKRVEILAESIEDDLPSIFDKERKSLLE